MYQLDQKESIRQGMRRVAGEELQRAHDLLQRAHHPAQAAIHEARKSLKKAQAICERIRADGGRGTGGCRRRLRRIKRALAPFRDADVMLETLSALRRRRPRPLGQHAYAQIRRRLLRHKQAVLTAMSHRSTWKTVLHDLSRVRHRSERWHSAHRNFRALSSGIRITYREGQAAMTRARKRGLAADFHVWRTRIKALWYELRLLSTAGRSIRKDMAALHRAETWLGEDHNVTVLRAELSKDAVTRHVRGRVREVADDYQADLRKKALARLHDLYSHSAGDFVRDLKRAWREWQRPYH